MNSFVRRAAFALAFLDYNVLGSGAINGDSQMLWVRGDQRPAREAGAVPVVRHRSVSGRPRRPCGVGRRRLHDVHPLPLRAADRRRAAQAAVRPGDNDNYVRNSVKAVVDAYSGEVTFYVVDDQDPILAAWRSAFPNLFTPVEQMPAELREHLRYPEDLFRIQTDVYSKYRIDPALFFQRDGNAWSVAQAPSPTPTNSNGARSGAAAAADETITAARSDVRLGVGRPPVHAVLHGVRHEPARRADEERVRAVPSVRAVLDERHPHASCRRT